MQGAPGQTAHCPSARAKRDRATIDTLPASRRNPGNIIRSGRETGTSGKKHTRWDQKKPKVMEEVKVQKKTSSETIKILQDPKDGSRLNLFLTPEGSLAGLVNLNTGQKFRVKNGIPDFTSEEFINGKNQKYPWVAPIACYRGAEGTGGHSRIPLAAAPPR